MDPLLDGFDGFEPKAIQVLVVHDVLDRQYEAMQMDVEDTHVRGQMKAEPERMFIRLDLVPLQIQSSHGLLSKGHQPFKNGGICDVKCGFDMFFGAGQDVCPRGGDVEVVEGKALFILGDD